MTTIANMDGTPFTIERLTGSTVKRARIMLGWSQGDLAHAVKLSVAAVGYIETGRTRIMRPRTERALRDVFAAHGVDLEGGSIRLQRPRLAVAE